MVGARRLGTRRGRACWHQLRGHDGLFSAAFFKFPLLAFALPLVLPVFPPVTQRNEESKSRRSPDLNRGERKGRGEVKRNRKNGSADDVCPRNIQVAD